MHRRIIVRVNYSQAHARVTRVLIYGRPVWSAELSGSGISVLASHGISLTRINTFKHLETASRALITYYSDDLTSCTCTPRQL